MQVTKQFHTVPDMTCKKLLFETVLFQFKFLWKKGSLKNNFFVNKSSIYPDKNVWRLSIIQSKFLGYNKWKGSVPDVTFRTWNFKRKQKITNLYSYLKRSMPETLFRTLANLLYFVQKNLSVRTFIIQKPVSKSSSFLVKAISKQALTHFQPVFHLNKPGHLFLLAKCLKKHMWEGDILSKQVIDLYLYLKTSCLVSSCVKY